jgi:glc operon protein GlcG
MEISLQLAQTLVDKAIAKAAADFKRPICVAICDKYGFLLAFGRMDGAPVRSIALSQGKAYSATRMGVDTDVFLERLNRENIPASYFCDDKLTGLPGGVVLKDSKDELIGGAGISGLKPEEDLAIANMMVAAVKQLLK